MTKHTRRVISVHFAFCCHAFLFTHFCPLCTAFSFADVDTRAARRCVRSHFPSDEVSSRATSSARSVLRSGLTAFSGCTASLARALTVPPWVTSRRASSNTRTTSVCSTGRQLRPRSVSLHWRVVHVYQRRWRCRRPSQTACLCTSGSAYQFRLRPLTSHTAAPNTRGICPTSRGLAVHQARGCRPGHRPASRRGQLADKAVKLKKRQTSAALLQPVVMEGESLETVHQFDYLGCRFTSDGENAADMRHIMAIAGERSRSLDYQWRDNRLPRSLKLRLYAASVCSTLTHGSEAWMLTARALTTLNGFNYRQLHRITGRSYREEATKPSYDLLTAVRTHHWLNHILRMPADRLVRRAVLALGQRAGPPYHPGSILMDTPLPLEELLLRAADRRG